MQKIPIGNKVIGNGKTFIIAEAGVNHNGSLERAKELVIKAAEAGADAIKFQTYTADDLVVKGTPKFWDADVDFGLDQYQAYKELEGFKDEWYPDIMRLCEEKGIEFISTPFSIQAAEMLNEMGMKAFKIASSDLSYLQLLKRVAQFHKPIFLSTGASTIEEIKIAVDTILREGNKQIIILHCTLCYPTDIKDGNFNLIQTLQENFSDFPVGLSDHTLGIFPPAIAVAMGALVIEKHYTVDNTLDKSADHWLSVDPSDLEMMIENIRVVEDLKGATKKKIFDCEDETRTYDKRSLVSVVDIDIGEKFTPENVGCKRPGTGISPIKYDELIGKTAKRLVIKDTTITWKDVSEI